MDNLKEQMNIDTDIDDIKLEEVTKAIKSMKNKKATVRNGINVELVKYSGSIFHLRLLHFLNMCRKLLRTPK
jgi:PHP family Zn ribbon phosphoesterase